MIAILAPSIGSFFELVDGEQVVMDFSEEEENSEQNTFEFVEKHFVNNNLQSDLSFLGIEKSHTFCKKDIGLIISDTKEVSLPPPKV